MANVKYDRSTSDMLKKYEYAINNDLYIKRNPYNAKRLRSEIKLLVPHTTIKIFDKVNKFIKYVDNKRAIDCSYKWENYRIYDKPMDILSAGQKLQYKENKMNYNHYNFDNIKYENKVSAIEFIDETLTHQPIHIVNEAVITLFHYLKYWNYIDKNNPNYRLFRAYEYIFHHSSMVTSYYDQEILDKDATPTVKDVVTCICTDIFDKIRFDEDGSIHCIDGPAISFKSGSKFYVYRGMEFPSTWITNKKALNAKRVMAIRDVEMRRIAIEILGWGKMLKQLKARVIDKDPNPQVGTLYYCDTPEFGEIQLLQIKCGTGRTFVLPVPEYVTTAREANAWTYGFDDETKFIVPEVRT